MKNVAASVRQRLLDRARQSQRPFEDLLIHYAMERFLYRLSLSRHRDRFILKGALMFTAWDISPLRTTRDIDLLGHTENSPNAIANIMREICREDVLEDGLVFDPETVRAERIIEHGMYEGVRVSLTGHLANAPVVLRMDIGFGDPVVPAPEALDYPTILDMPRPVLRGYTRESVIAEKLEAMVKLGEINSRMKDFHDIVLLSRRFDFEGSMLSEAISRTFERRGTTISADPVALQPSFAELKTKQNQWRAFLRRQQSVAVPDDFADVVRAIREFLGPVLLCLSEGDVLAVSWHAPGPWA